MTYEKAMAELIELENTDVITTSGETSSEWCGEPNENGWGGGEVTVIAAENITVPPLALTATGFRLNDCDTYDTNKLTSPYAYLAFQ